MKHSLMLLVVAATLSLVGCSKKNAGNPIAPNNPGTQPVNVTFTMHLESGTQGMIFVASPNEDVKLKKIELSYPAGNFTNTVTNPNPETLIAKGSNVQINEYAGIEGGQKWVLVFHGTHVKTEQAFVVTVNWTVV